MWCFQYLFSAFCGTHHKKSTSWFFFFWYSIFIFNIQKTAYNFWAFSFSWKWISCHFRKKTNFMGPTNSKLSYQNLSLSLSLLMVVVVNRWERSMAMLTGSGLLLAVVVFWWIGLLKWIWWLFVLGISDGESKVFKGWVCWNLMVDPWLCVVYFQAYPLWLLLVCKR